jgi:hypothetical protein
MDQNEMSNVYRGSSIDASYQVILTNGTTGLGVYSVLIYLKDLVGSSLVG